MPVSAGQLQMPRDEQIIVTVKSALGEARRRLIHALR
jgi:hypothetical protein